MLRATSDLTAQDVRRQLSYDPETGEVRWLVSPGGQAKVGKMAGCIDNTGYRHIVVNKRRYVLHRIIWLHYYGEWPKHTIDHINRDRLDNRICNLRDATYSEQMLNTRGNSRNTSGYRGVDFHRGRGLWMARLSYQKKRTYLGMYKTKEEAFTALTAALKQKEIR